MLISAVRDAAAGMLVIDHFSQVLGDCDENTSAVSKIMSSLRGVAESQNLALILIHHQVKSAARFGITASDALRGHGSILASCDLAAVVERQVTDPLGVNIRPVAVRGPNVPEFAAKFSFEHKQDGSQELESARFFGVKLESLDDEIEAAVVSALQANSSLNQTALRAAVAEHVTGAGDPAIRSMLTRLERDGRVIVKKGVQNSKIYRLPGGADEN